MSDAHSGSDELRDAIAWTDSLVVRPSTIHGLGVFARRPFAAGDVVERVPCVPIPDDEITYDFGEDTGF